MMSMVLPKIRRGAIRLGLAVSVAVALSVGTVAMSQAADSSQVTYSANVPKSYPIFAGLAPDRIYVTTTYTNGMIWSAPVSSDLKLGTWQSLLPVRSTFVFTTSAGRAIMVDKTGKTVLFDRGQQVSTLLTPLRASSGVGRLSGSWYTTDTGMASIDGTVVDTGKYTYSTEDGWAGVVDQYGSLFLVESDSLKTSTCGTDPWTYSCSKTTSVQLTVRDAANSGKAVGMATSLQPPAGATFDDLRECSLQPTGVDCVWAKSEDQIIELEYGSTTFSQLKNVWVTRSSYLTDKTTTVALPIPSEVTSIGQEALYLVTTQVEDGAIVLDYYAFSMDGNASDMTYAYSLDDPSHMVRIDASRVYTVVNNRLVVGNSNGTYRVAELPFGGESAPHVIGVTGTRNVPQGGRLNLQLDLSKPVQAGTVTIADSSGSVVATLESPASTDGSLRGLIWTVPADASGTYTWTLNVKDAAGQEAVNNVGDGKASGTFTVRDCTKFTDVAASNTFASAICWASAAGITKGTGDGTTYSPSNPVNRGSMAAFLYRLAGSPKWDAPKTSPFVDVPTTHAFYSAITWLYAQGVTVGTTVNGKVYYQPSNAVNRGAMSAFMYRIADRPKWDAPAVSPFTDIDQSNTFYPSVTWLASEKITVGSTVNGKLVYQAGNPVNRGSMAAFMNRLAKTDLQCMRYNTAVGC